MSNRRDIQFFYTPHNKSTLLDCSFVVDSTAAEGVSGLQQSGRIASVYMHSSSPSASNPNPAGGVIVVNLQDNYNKYLGGFNQVTAPLDGSDIDTGLGVGGLYIISDLGASTAAQWQAAGVPANLTPAVGMAFIAQATSIAGGGQVQGLATNGSEIVKIDLAGNPSLANSNGAYVLGASNGMQLIFVCYDETNSIAAPLDGSKINLAMYLNNSAQGV